MVKRRVLLTGASGSMGKEAFLELMRRTDRVKTRLLLRPSRVNKKQFARYDGRDGVEIIWGDLTNPADVNRAVDGVDVVMHPAALISPAADRNPSLAYKINVGGTQNIISAIKCQPDGINNIALVYVGSVAQYGDRLPPHEWINVGDPLKPSVHDYYALTKMEAETAVIESGLKYWVSLRQTYIAIPNTLSLMDPIMFHQPLDQRIELITDRDAGYGLVQTLEVPDEFWGRVYNMSGGPNCRVMYADYMDRVFSTLGLGSYKKIFERNWFALKNFHCGYYQDSDDLHEHLGHFRDGLEDHLTQLDAAFPKWMKSGGALCPKPLIKAYMKRMAEPLHWIQQGKTSHIEAFYGSREAFEAIPGWHAPIGVAGSEKPDKARGFNLAELDLVALNTFAALRGGTCQTYEYLGPSTQVDWTCAKGHRFKASPNLLIGAGYWCPTCAPSFEDESGWDYHANRDHDPLLATFL